MDGSGSCSSLRMFRLLQGDVGSGKTAVAFLAMLRAAGQGSQSCMLAPTEVLTVQHLQVCGDTFVLVLMRSIKCLLILYWCVGCVRVCVCLLLASTALRHVRLANEMTPGLRPLLRRPASLVCTRGGLEPWVC